MIYSTINLILFVNFRVVIHSFDTKKTQNGVNKTDRIMHSQGGKGIFHNSKNIYRNLLKKTKKDAQLYIL